LIAVLVVAKGLAQRENLLGEIGLFDEALRPEPLHQVFFPNQAAVVLHEDAQRFEGFGSQGEDLPVAPEQAFSDVESERAELEYLRLLPLH
jgi:hypothetical protein